MMSAQELKKQALDSTTAPFMIVQEIPLSLIRNNPYQMRKKYGDIKSLADSIAVRGLQNPISVIRVEEHYIIVSGHRRVRAYRELHRKSIPCIIRRESKPEDLATDIAVENLQRADLTPVEKADTLLQLIYTIASVQNNPSRATTLINQVKLFERREGIGTDFLGKYGFKEDDLFRVMKLMKLVGMSCNTATQYVRIFDLPEDIQEVIVNGDDGHTCSIPEGKISVKTAYELTRIKDPEIQRQLFNKVINERLKYIQLKFVVDEIIENNSSVANRNLNKGTAARRIEDDAGASKLTEDLFKLSSTVWNFRRKLPLICRRLDKVLWVAALNKMKKASLEMVLAINNLLREDMKLEDWLEYVNADFEINLKAPSREGEKLRFSFPRDVAEILGLDAGDKLLVRIEGVVRHGGSQEGDDNQEEL